MTTIIVKKRAHPQPIRLPNGDAYDGLLEVLDEAGNAKASFHVNTDPTNNYNGGEVAPGEYIYRKRVRVDGRIVYDVLTKDGGNILPSTKPNPNHGGKKIIQAVQIHCGGRSWDGSRGCLTLPPDEWWAFRQVIADEGVVKILDTEKREAKKVSKQLDNDDKESV